MYTPAEGTQPLREDIVRQNGDAPALMACAPSPVNNCYAVPKVIE